MRAIVTQGPDLLWREVPDPIPARDEVLIDVRAAGVNRADVLQRAGHYPPPPGAPAFLGLECAGVVAAVGSDAMGPNAAWQVGDRVCALLPGGGYAERVCVDAGLVLPIPAGLSFVQAAALPEAAATAWSNLVMTARLQRGESVLIQGGSGGVGSLAIQLAHALGAEVLATAGGPERAAACERLGARLGIDHRGGDVLERVHAATDGRGVDVVLDVVGAAALATILAMLAPDGRLVVIGMQGGRRAQLDLGELLARRATIAGTTLRSRPLAQRRAIVAAVRAELWPLVASGEVCPVVGLTLPLPDAAAAHAALAAGEVFGKAVLTAPTA